MCWTIVCNLFRQASFRPKKGIEFEELVNALSESGAFERHRTWTITVGASALLPSSLEGLLLAGAFTAASVTYYAHSPWVGLGAAMVAGALRTTSEYMSIPVITGIIKSQRTTS